MAHKDLPMGVKHPLAQALLNGEIRLDRRTQRLLKPFLTEMALHVKESEATQDAISTVHLYTLWKSDQTLTLAELLRTLRSPLAPDEDLDQLHDALRRRYLEAMAAVADRGIHRIVDARSR